MRYPIDYKIICQPNESDCIAITSPSGETSINRVRQDVFNQFGRLDLYEVDKDTFFKIYPGNRILRNAWKFNERVVFEDFDLSRKLIRERRNRLLNYLDKVAYRESRIPKGNLRVVNYVCKLLRDIPAQTQFNSSDIQCLRDLIIYMDNICKVMNITSGINPEFAVKMNQKMHPVLFAIKNKLSNFSITKNLIAVSTKVA